MKRLEVHSDGSSGAGGGKPGGWAWIIYNASLGKVVCTASGNDLSTTNNVMEITGALNGLRALRNTGIWTPGDYVMLVSDSQYVLGMASGRMSPTMNHDLVAQLKQALREVRGGTRWVRGHQLKKGQDWRVPPPRYMEQKPTPGPWTDVLLNDRCDKLAHAAKQKAKALLGLI